MNNRTIRVRGSAKISGVPDWVVIYFDVDSLDYEYEKCLQQLASQTESLRKELAQVGLEKESLKTSHFSLNTHFEHYERRRVFKGYVASQNIRVEFPFDKDYLNKVLQALGSTASKATFRISFIIKDPEPLRRQAIAEAVKNCKEKASVLAEAAGVSLGELIQIDYSWSEIRFESRMEVCEARSSIAEDSFAITPDDVDVSDSVTAIWAIN